jgi:hypothetical protein
MPPDDAWPVTLVHPPEIKMKSIACLVALLGALTAGCASGTDPAEGGLVTNMSPIDYARLLCAPAEIENYATCVNGMLAVYEDPPDTAFPPAQASSGPFMVMLGANTYYGWYRSHPFAADFRVSDGRTICRGGYSAFAGSVDTIFSVTCDDGQRGTARIVRDASGRNGVGTLTMSDGAAGRIVFGRDVLKGTPASG